MIGDPVDRLLLVCDGVRIGLLQAPSPILIKFKASRSMSMMIDLESNVFVGSYLIYTAEYINSGIYEAIFAG